MAQKLTNVWLCSGVPLDAAHNHTIMFSNATAQNQYFLSKYTHAVSNCSYQREFRRMAYPASKDTISNANYIAYQNNPYTNKWYYAFIDRIEYVNDGNSYIYFTIDAYQTYQFDFTLGQAFIEREHTDSDRVGEYTLDEPVSLGDYYSFRTWNEAFDKWWLVVGSTIDLEETSQTAGASFYGGIYAGMKYYTYSNDNLGLVALTTVLTILAQNGQSDAIVTMFMVPDKVTGGKFVNGKELDDSLINHSTLVSYTVSSNLGGYNPKNKKLLTYPYKAIMISNGSGQTIQLRPEWITDYPTLKFFIFGGVHPGSRCLGVPDYMRVAGNKDYAITLADYPQVSWQTDVYANWLAGATVKFGYAEDRLKASRQANVRAAETVGGIAGQVAGTAIAGVVGGGEVGRQIGQNIGNIAGRISEYNPVSNIQAGMDYYNIKSAMEEEKEIHAIEPNAVRGTIGNDFTWLSVGQSGFTICERCINEEHARAIDNFFTAFGYKVNRLGTPNLNSRPNWNYIKCSSITLDGNAPADALENIRNMFLSGITFWHTTDVGNYSLNNQP